MKFDFWFDLPGALCNIITEALTQEDIAYSKILAQSAEVFQEKLQGFGENLEEEQNQIQIEELELIKEKLQAIHKQRVELLCKCVKFSTKLMMKIISSFENYQSSTIPLNEILVKIKLFSKITRLIIDNSKFSEVSSQEGNEFKFFSMILIFTEKIQSRMYAISKSIIQSFMDQKKQCENQITWRAEIQMQIETKEPIENLNSC